MAEQKKERHWAKQVMAKDCVEIDCPGHDGYKDFRLDSSGYYVLIRIEWDILKIAVAICNKKHEIVAVFRGSKVQDVYCAIFRFEKEHKVEWFKTKEHIAYLGKELKKAEIAMAMGIKDYFQE